MYVVIHFECYYTYYHCDKASCTILHINTKQTLPLYTSILIKFSIDETFSKYYDTMSRVTFIKFLPFKIYEKFVKFYFKGFTELTFTTSDALTSANQALRV